MYENCESDPHRPTKHKRNKSVWLGIVFAINSPQKAINPKSSVLVNIIARDVSLKLKFLASALADPAKIHALIPIKT